MGVSQSTLDALRRAGHDVVHASEEGLAQAADAEILAKAVRERRIVVTFDLDFGELLAAGGGRLPSVIVFRLRDQTPAAVMPRLVSVLSEAAEALESGAVVIVEESRYRVRRLPIGP